MKDDQKRTLYVLIPVYNEEETVTPLLEKVLGVDVSRFGLAIRLVVVDDGSTDGTPDRIAQFMKDHPGAHLIHRRLDKNRGKGRAIREGLDLCDQDDGIVLIQDADLEYYPEEYPILIKPIVSGMTRVVFGSRWIFPGRMSKSGWIYTFGGWLENQYLKMLYRTNISDIATCYKVMPVGLMKSLNLKCRGFEFCPEVTAKLLNRGETIMEVPIGYKARKKNEGKKIKWTDFFIAIYTLTRLRLTGK